MKRHRWADDDGEESDDDHPTTYLGAVRQPILSPPRTQIHSIVVLGGGTADTERQGHGQRRQNHRRPRPQLVHGLPTWPVEGHVSAHQRLGRCRRVSTPNADGW